MSYFYLGDLMHLCSIFPIKTGLHAKGASYQVFCINALYTLSARKTQLTATKAILENHTKPREIKNRDSSSVFRFSSNRIQCVFDYETKLYYTWYETGRDVSSIQYTRSILLESDKLVTFSTNRADFRKMIFSIARKKSSHCFD